MITILRRRLTSNIWVAIFQELSNACVTEGLMCMNVTYLVFDSSEPCYNSGPPPPP